MPHGYRTRASSQQPTDSEGTTNNQQIEQEQEISPMTQETATTTTNMARPAKKYLNRKIEVLDSLDPDLVKEFQHAFEHTNAIGSRRTMMTKKVLEAIEGEGVNTKKEEEIKVYLDKIIEDDLKGNVKSGFKYMKQKLAWPEGDTNVQNKINAFIRQAQQLKQYVKDYNDDKRVREDVFHMVRKKLPRAFGIRRDTIREDPGLVDIKALGQELKKRSWAMEIKTPTHKQSISSLEQRVMDKLRKKGLLSDTESDEDTSNETEPDKELKQRRKKRLGRVRYTEANVVEDEEIENDSLQAQMNRIEAQIGQRRCYECGDLNHYRAQCPHLIGNKPTVNVAERNNQQMIDLVTKMVQNLTDHPNNRRNWETKKERDPSRRRPTYTQPQQTKQERIYHINRLAVGTVLPRARIQVQNPEGNWTHVPGILDSGSGTTVGSLQNHRHLLKQTRPVKNRVTIQLVNKDQFLAKEVAKVRMRVIDSCNRVREFSNEVTVFLVDAPEWKELIVGFPTLRREGLLPEQHLHNKTERTNTRQN